MNLNINLTGIASIFEKHAEKIVLGVVGIICLWLLWAFVLSSPNATKIGSQKYGPGEIDNYIKGKADRLAEAIDEPVTPTPYPIGRGAGIFAKTQANPLENVSDFQIVVPGKSDTVIEEDRMYAAPIIGGVDQVLAAAFRGTAHVPADEVAMDNPYDKARTELADMDLVTVEAQFDIAGLYRSFKQSFVFGRGLKAEWRDEELGMPVFAAAQLQRRRKLEDGGWSDWEVVARPRIDKFRKLLDLPEDVSELRFDIVNQVRQFASFECQQNILQPDPYDFASENVSWLTPSFHMEYVKVQEREALEKRREELDRKRGITRGGAGMYDEGYGPGGGRTARRGVDPRRATGPAGRRSPQDLRNRRDMTDGRGGYDYDMYGEEGMMAGRFPGQNALQSVVAENQKVLINDRTKLDEMREMLYFWAHDDTVEPGNTYQYKIRLGVFNPVAGKGWFVKADSELSDKVVLWSDFSDVTEEIVIDPMVHFFATDMARTRDRAVDIQVAKYHMGNWRSEIFEVHPGEMIGKTVELKTAARPMGDEYERYEGYDGYGGAGTQLPKEIDFGTGAMLVDIVKTDMWTGIRALSRTQIADALYTNDGVTMLHLPVKRNNWTNEMKTQFAAIEDAAGEEVKVNTARNQRNKLLDRNAAGRFGPGRMDPAMMYDYGGDGRGLNRPYVD